MNKVLVRCASFAATLVAPALFHSGLLAATPPVANTVPFVASNPVSPHTSWSGNPVILKGTLTSAAFGTDTFTYDWNPGDGGTHCTGTVTNQWAIECAHTYTGSVGTLFTAVLTITDTTTGLVSAASNCPPGITKGACYYTSLYAPPPNLAIEVNNAIDNGLWLLHKTMVHATSSGGTHIGNWSRDDGSETDAASSGDTGPSSLDCSAFMDSGFLTTNTPSNPYSNDVSLCIAGVFDQLTTLALSNITVLPFSAYNPDSNGNGIGVEHNGGYVNYQTGMMMDALIASGTPNSAIPAGTTLATAITSGSVKGSGAGGAYLFKDAVFDMVDDYSYCQNPGEVSFGTTYDGGGWHYTCQDQGGDNSVSQWAAIGIIPARRVLDASMNDTVQLADLNWLDSSFNRQGADNGYFGYTSNSTLWGPYADTPSGLVQLAMSGLGRGTTSPGGNNLWDSAETFLRDNFGNAQGSGAGNALKDYYYGMFSFTKAMLLHDNTGTATTPTGLTASPITLLQSLDDPGTCAAPGVPVTSPGSGTGPCYPPLDWYGAQSAAFGGTAPTDGVARTIIGNQNLTGVGCVTSVTCLGSWYGQNYTGAQNYFQTAVAIIMLNKTVFQPVPVACFTTNPSHIASGGTSTLNGNCSIDQNPSNTIVSWWWDIDGTGGTNFTVKPGSPDCLTPTCSSMKAPFKLPTGGMLPYSYPVRLRVTDNAGLTADVVGDVIISSPPNPPTANAGGPYNFCPNMVSGKLIYAPFILNGAGSTNPDQGLTDGTPGAPPSTIVSYLWDYSCSGAFTSASGVQVNATTAFDVPADFGTSFNVCLKVTNNDNLAFPTAMLAAGLSSTASATVSIHNPTDEVCSHCVSTIEALPKEPTPTEPGNIQLYWTDTNNATNPITHYNVYRSTSSTFIPNAQIAGAASNPPIPAPLVTNPSGGTVYFLDSNVVGGTTYYYRVAPATANDTETCSSNVTQSVELGKGR
jgi:hypothetical protein